MLFFLTTIITPLLTDYAPSLSLTRFAAILRQLLDVTISMPLDARKRDALRG